MVARPGQRGHRDRSSTAPERHPHHYRSQSASAAVAPTRQSPTGILTPDDLGMLGEGEEGQPIAGTLPDQALRLGLRKEGEESPGVLQIIGDDVTQGWGLDGGRRAVFLKLVLNTSRESAGGGGSVLVRLGWCGDVRLSSGLLVLKLLEGLLVFLKKGW